MRNLVVACLIVLSLTVGVSALRATPITIYSTGVDASGNLLADGVLDPHYSLISSPNGAGSAYVVISAQGGWPAYQFPAWAADGPSSKWIGPQADQTSNANNLLPGTYTYETTFTLTANQVETFSINGIWSTDNNGLDIIVNGHSLGYTTPFTAYQDFDATHYLFMIDDSQGFLQAGVNTLDFVVANGLDVPNPAGLRVQFSSVPEPLSMSLMGLGLLGIGLLRRRFLR